MIFIVILIMSILTVEVFIRLSLRNNVELLLDVLKKSFLILKSSQISDHWKEKILPAYSLQIISQVIQITTRTVGIIACPLLFLSLTEVLNPIDDPVWSILGRWDALAASFVFSWIFYRLRRRNVE